MANSLEDREAERRRLTESAARNEALLASIGDGALAVDEGGRLIFMNEAASRLLRWPRSAALGKKLLEVLLVQDEAGKPLRTEDHPFYRALRHGRGVPAATLSTPRASAGTLYFIRRSGERFPTSITVAPVQLDGKVIGAIGTFRDLTAEVNVDRARRDFMNIAAHDLRAPITAIKGFVRMIRKGEFGRSPGGKIGEALRDIEEGADRMIEMVNTFLTVARIEQGKLRLRPKPIAVAPLLDELRRKWRVTAGSRPVKVTVKLPKSLPRVMADRAAIAEVFTNLVDNAFKHTERGRIAIAAHSLKAGFAGFAVADTGQGIPAGDLPRIFERYFKGTLAEVAPGRGSGLGLGLYTAKILVEAHGGNVRAESTVGKGTTIRFTLPVAA